MDSIQEKNNYLYLVWNNPIDHSNYIVGSLHKGEEYTFEYNKEFIEKANEQGIDLLHAFPDAEKVYSSKGLFPAFSSRLPDKKRRDIDKILEKYGLKEFDEFELLKCGGGRLPIDTYEFINPIFPEDESIIREFYIMGMRHYGDCQGINCIYAPNYQVDEEVELRCEPSNTFDKNAVQVYRNDKLIGYVPRYYSEAVSKRLNKGMSYKCKIIEIIKDQVCNECVKVKLIMPRN